MMRGRELSLTGWNRYPTARCRTFRPERISDLAVLPDNVIPRGRGLSYGDAALNHEGNVVLSERLDRLVEFDPVSGAVRCEAGVTMGELVATFLPQGWFPIVTPGTRGVSLGGCVAADVHGKNHHQVGAFMGTVGELLMRLPDGTLTRCSRQHDPSLFRAAFGGMGLVGMVVELTLQLQPVTSAWMLVEERPAADLDALLSLLAEDDPEMPYAMAWVDGLARGAALGRGVVTLGRHAEFSELPDSVAEPLAYRPATPRRVPGWFPPMLLNRTTVGLFNGLYRRFKGRRQGRRLLGVDPFFYPLDALAGWNTLYGRKGFLQYQCLLPPQGAADGLRAILEHVTTHGPGVFLAVLKRMGPADRGYLSFPGPGYTLALDFPRRRAALDPLLMELDRLVMARGGRVYLAKDTRLPPQNFRHMYPHHQEFWAVKQRVDPGGAFRSDLARRLEMGG